MSENELIQIAVVDTDIDWSGVQREMEFVEMLDALEKTHEVDRRLAEALPDMDWTTFGAVTAAEFVASAVEDSNLQSAIEIHVELVRQRAVSAELAVAWSQRVADRLAPLNRALGRDSPAQTEFCAVEAPELASRTARSGYATLSPSAGLLLRFDLPGRELVGHDPDFIRIGRDECSIALNKPFRRRSVAATENSFVIYGDRMSAELSMPATFKEGMSATCLFLTSELAGVMGRTVPFPDGHGARTRRLQLDGPGWKATLDLDDDSRLLFDSGFYDQVLMIEEGTKIARLTVVGDKFRDFPYELLYAVIAQTTHHEIRRLEWQLETPNFVTAVEIPSTRPTRTQHWWREKQHVEYEEIEAAWSGALKLPSDGKTFSQYHLCVAVHAIATAVRQPVQKSLVDLYCVLDTLALVHPNVLQLAMPENEFKRRKKVRLRVLGIASKATGDAADAATIADIANLVSNQQNYAGVKEKILSLLRESNVSVDLKDEITKCALSWRNQLAHNLASLPIRQLGTKGATVQEMVEVRRRLLSWCHGVIGSLLERPGPRGEAVAHQSKEGSPR